MYTFDEDIIQVIKLSGQMVQQLDYLKKVPAIFFIAYFYIYKSTSFLSKNHSHITDDHYEGLFKMRPFKISKFDGSS